MKNSHIQKYNPGKSTLEPHSYTLALLIEGRRRGVLGPQAVDEFQAQLTPLLAELILKYTRGESSSVTVETAQRLLGSILYSIDACLRSFSHKEAALLCLQNCRASEMYTRGQALIATYLEQTWLLYEKVRAHKLHVPLKAYHSTIDKDIPDFLNNYDLLFNAQDTMANMDYPLLFDDMRLQGVLYINQYLRKLSMETDYCHMFFPTETNKLLFDYGRVYRLDISGSLINVFEILFTNSLFSYIVGNRPGDLNISYAQLDSLKHKFAGLAVNDCSLVISRAIDKLLKFTDMDNVDFVNYVEGFIPLFIPRFMNALENDCLANVIIPAQPREGYSRVILDGGQLLPDDAFRELIDLLRDCMEPTAKASLIRKHVTSLPDFLDVLEADCLFDQDYAALFNTLSEIELSILAKIVFAEQLRCNSLSFELRNIDLQDLTVPWHLELAHYFETMLPQRSQAVEQRLNDPLFIL